ncbi:hypothetical protein BDW62DRAFT_86733 [Aspergillus aurantiobrunneus]
MSSRRYLLFISYFFFFFFLFTIYFLCPWIFQFDLICKCRPYLSCPASSIDSCMHASIWFRIFNGSAMYLPACSCMVVSFFLFFLFSVSLLFFPVVSVHL